MPPWVLKAAVQGVTSLLPGAEHVNRMLQRFVTGSLELDEATLLSKYGRCRQHLANYAAHGAPRSAVAVMELGTGWFPVAPVGFALCGAAPVWSVDIVSHLAREQVLAVLRGFVACAPRLEGVVPERLARLERVLADPAGGPDELLAAVGVTNVLADARSLDVGRRIDLIVSNNTLEHIPYEVMHDMFVHFRELVSEGGLMSHWIDMSDHYMNFDGSIGPYNFLKFPGPLWRLFNNKHQYQNRLRLPDFRHLHRSTGWTVVEERNTAGRAEELRRIRIAREFRRYREEDLLVYETWMVSRSS
jgi:hypothetical protein